MGGLTLRDNLYTSSTNSIWVCLIEGRFLVSKRGTTAWQRKSDSISAFKHSDYWRYIVCDLKLQHPDLISQSSSCGGKKWWLDRKRGEQIEKEKFNELMKDGIIQFIEIKPVPNWVNI